MGAAQPERLGRWIATLVAPAIALGAFAAIAPIIRLDHPLALLGAGILAFVCVSAEVLLAAASVPRLSRWALLALPLPAAVLVGVGTAGSVLPDVLEAALVTAALLALGTLVGAVVGEAIEHPGHLVVVVAVSALVDAFSVLHPSGPTAQLVQLETAVSLLLLPWPIFGTDRIEPILGVGDITFAALYLAASRRHALPKRRTVLALALGLAATLVVLAIAQIGIPALPFLGAAILLMHPEARRIPHDDRLKAGLGVGLLAAILAALFVLRR